MSIDFQVSDLSVSSTLTALSPTLEAGSAVTALSGHNAVIELDVTEAAARAAFLFKSDSSDLAGADNERLTATTTTTAAGLPVPTLSTDEVENSAHADAATGTDSNQMDVSAAVQTVAADYVRYFSKQILGQNGLADVFSNEAALVTSVEGNAFTGIGVADIRGLAATQGVMDKLFDNLFQSDGNEAHDRLSDTEITEVASGPDSSGITTFKFPFKNGDTIRYHVTLQHADVTFGNETKPVSDRKYLVIVNVGA
jgi:hypothetical protein